MEVSITEPERNQRQMHEKVFFFFFYFIISSSQMGVVASVVYVCLGTIGCNQSARHLWWPPDRRADLQHL